MIRLAHEACLRFGIERPRVAVAGLNPHAGENGLFGREDMETILPAVEKARAAGIDASGPWAGDTIFMRARRGEFDVVVAQYHDQGLIPVKYLGVEEVSIAPSACLSSAPAWITAPPSISPGPAKPITRALEARCAWPWPCRRRRRDRPWAVQPHDENEGRRRGELVSNRTHCP